MATKSELGKLCNKRINSHRINVMIWNPRGSRWHRWDPHLHAPGTLLADQFAGDWEAYLSAVENSDPPLGASIANRCLAPIFRRSE